MLVIIGAGMAGCALIRELRAREYSLPITLVDLHAQYSYPKPPLSTFFTRQTEPLSITECSIEDFCAQHQVTFIKADLRSIDIAQQQVHLTDRVLSFTQLVLAVGGKARLPYGHGPHLYPYNNLDDLMNLYRDLKPTDTVGIIGSGFVACEVVNDFLVSHRVQSVSLLMNSSVPLQHRLPLSESERLARVFTEHGATVYPSMIIKSVQSSSDKVAVVSEKGSLSFDKIIIACGISVPTELCPELAGEVGFEVDALLQTRAKNIYALGDCAAINQRSLPYVQPMKHQARALAMTLTGQPTKVVMPVLPMSLKTSLYPICLFGPYSQEEVRWDAKGQGCFEAYDNQGVLIGACLSGRDALGLRVHYQEVLSDSWQRWTS